jgi:tetratricopeptide (TPR) repeat protein
MTRNSLKSAPFRWILAAALATGGAGIGPAAGQDADRILRTGRSLEDAGEWERAEEWYAVQAAQNPEQAPIAERLFECRMKRRRFEEAAVLAGEWLGKRPGDFRWMILRARSLYALGRRREARDEWDRILGTRPPDASLYLLVASGMRRDGLLEPAESVLSAGREKTGFPDAFIFDLTDVRVELGRFDRAAEDLLAYGAARPDRMNGVREALDRFPRTGKAPDEVLDAFEKVPDRADGYFDLSVEVLRFALQAERTGAAYRVAERMEAAAAPSRRGEGLAEFARQAAECGDLKRARGAYGEILRRYPDSPRVRPSWMGLMKINRSEERWAEAVSCCDAALSGKTDPAFQQQVLVEKGRLIRDGLFDPNRAKAVFAGLSTRFPAAAARGLWKIEEGRCDLLTGELDSAETVFREALTLGRRGRNGDWITPLVWLARTLSYRGDFGTALDTLNAVTLQALNPDLLSAASLNDALDLKARLSVNRNRRPDDLRRIFEAEWMELRGLRREAIAVLDSVPSGAEGLFPEALLRKASIYFELGRDGECRAELGRLFAAAPPAGRETAGLLLLGKAEERSGSVDRAADAYDRILRIDPRSADAGEARERIRTLRRGTER